MLKVFLCKFPIAFSHARKKQSLHGFVRQILQQELHLAEPPRIERYPQGKPYLPDFPGIFFNYSDSGDYAALAVSDAEVGVDIESLRMRSNYAEILKRFFLPEEMETVLQADTEHLRLVRFFRLWTQKESLLKYEGCGIGQRMGECKVIGNQALCADKKLPLRTYTVKQRQIKVYGEQQLQMGDVLLTLCSPKAETPVFAPILFLPE